jgi:lysozyme
MDPTLTPKKKLLRQMASDLDRHEAFREFAYPDVLSALYKRFPNKPWGFKPAREILSEIGVSVEEAERTGKPWTYGFGFTQGGNVDSKIDRLRAQRKLETHILEEDAKLSKVLSWYDSAPFVVKTVLINMSFNMGLQGLLGFRNTLNYMKQGSWKQAATNMRKSLWYRQVGDRAIELTRRIETQEIAPQHLVAAESKPDFSNVISGSSTVPRTKDA